MGPPVQGVSPEILEGLMASGRRPFLPPPDMPDFTDPEYIKHMKKTLASQGILPSFPTPDEVRNEARQRSKKIFKSWCLINRILQRYEAVIQKRWLKKTREQRRKVLITAWPGMSVQSRPDIDALMREKDGRLDKFAEPYKWPYISQEDLIKPKLFLILLNARGRHFPSAFSLSDFNSIHIGVKFEKLITAVLYGYTMMFAGRDTPETYGEILAWKEHENPFNQRGADPGEGLLILEIQERIYSFLETCCFEMLHDISIESLVRGDAPIQPEPALPTAEPGTISLAAISEEAHYRLPARLDISRLQGLLAAKRSAAEDHLLSLREDPSYFADVTSDTKDHLKVLLSGLLVEQPTKEEYMTNVLRYVVMDAYHEVAAWDCLFDVTTELELLLEQYKHDIVPEKDLPSKLLEHFLILIHCLLHFTRRPIAKLKKIIPTSLPLRSQCVRKTCAGTNDKKRQRLMWMFEVLFQPHSLQLIDFATLMGQLIESERGFQELLTARVISTISDLAVISECQRQISLYQPWCSTFLAEASHRCIDISEKFTARMSGLEHIGLSLGIVSLAALGDPSDGKFNYPVEKRKTRENTETMQLAERNLDHFWEKVDSVLIPKDGFAEHPALHKLLSDKHILRRTPDWIEPDPETKEGSTQQLDSIEDLCKPLSQIHFELELRTQRTISDEKSAPSKAKTKTRGLTGQAESQAETLPRSTTAPDPQPVFTVDKRAYKVFSTLFYKPSRTSQPKEIPWSDFLHAMSVTGFAIEKLYDSVWQFTPSNLDVERSIQFHEPHPAGKMPYRMTRRYGQRLSRAYGWNADLFRVAV